MKKILTFTFSTASLILFAGCTSKQTIMSDITPAMQTLSQTQNDVNIDINMTDNQNLRMAEEDLGRVWYTNRPSRLSSFPVVNTTGSSQ
jgi:uncharacterized lipoprotein YajG